MSCSVLPLSFCSFFPMAGWQLNLKKGYNPFASHQSSEWWSAPRHERVFWKENDLIHFSQSYLKRQYLLICKIDTTGRRWQKGGRKQRDLSSKNYTPFTFSPSKHQHCMTGQQHDQPLMAAAPVWMRGLCMTALWARLHAKTSVSHLNIIPHSWSQSSGDLW